MSHGPVDEMTKVAKCVGLLRHQATRVTQFCRRATSNLLSDVMTQPNYVYGEPKADGINYRMCEDDTTLYILS
jgi:hypothetical protein